MTVVNPVTIGTAAKIVSGAFNILSGGGKPRVSPADRATLEAAGYKFEARARLGEVAIDPRGNVITNRDTLKRQATAARVLASVPDYQPTLADKVATAAKSPAGKRIIAAGGRIVGSGAGQIAIGVGIVEALRGVLTPPIAPEPKAPPKQPPKILKYPAWANPPITVPGSSPPPPTVAAPAPAPLPAPRPVDTEPLGPINVYTPYLPIPAVPAPSAPPAVSGAPSRSILGMSPAQLAQLGVPALLALLAQGSGGRRRARDPLTIPQTPGGFPGLGLTPGAAPLPWPGGSFFGGGGGSSSGTCECPPKRKRSSTKKRREVCYSGTFIERASGLSKSRKRKVPCR